MPLQLKLKTTGLVDLDAYAKSLAARTEDLTPAMRAIGESLLADIRAGFSVAGEPNGRPWAPLAPATWARKKTRTPMQESGELLNSVKAFPSSTGVVVGTALEYGGYHQTGYRHGRSKKSVPARPIVGFGPEGLEPAAQLLIQHLRRGS